MSANYVFDFTEKYGRTKEELILWMKKFTKKWGFQREIGEQTGYDHYQGRISLETKLRLGELIIQYPICGKWSLTSKENSSGDAFYNYVTKEDTRVEGPWKSKDKALYIPRQIKEIKELLPWQNSVVEKIQIWDTRHIDIIVDKEGCTGKSTLVGWACCNGLARKIPPLNNFKEMMCLTMSMPESRAYFVDMPRALDKNKVEEFYSAIESIKDGHLWDNRYTYKEKWIDSPNIWVFTNVPVNKKLLSKDRWRVWNITESSKLARA